MNEQASRPHLSRIGTLLYWVLPLVPFLLLYYRGLWCWFFGDDFSLLVPAAFSDRQWEELFQPRAQGTFRPLSERLFFNVFYSLFELDAFPYRAWVFATQVVNLWLLAAVTTRLTGERWAGFGAACLWGVHHGLSRSMTWSSAYNQVLCAFLFLLSFWLFLRFVETGRRRFYVLQWMTFLAGFGALETMVVYPLVALAHTLVMARGYWKHAAAMLPASGALVWLQLSSAPPREGVYSLYFEAGSLFEVFGHYTRRALGADLAPVFVLVIGGGLVGFVIFQARRGRGLGVFCLVWFAVTLAPYLPLRDHRLDYYLVLPTIGLAVAGGWAAWSAMRSEKAYRVAAAVCVGLFVYGSASRAQREVNYFHPLSLAVKRLVSDVSRARAEHPGKVILIADMPEMVFYLSMAHDAFRVVNVFDVYLTPDSDDIRHRSDYEYSIDRFFFSPEAMRLALERGQAVVYDASGERMVEVTGEYGGGR